MRGLFYFFIHWKWTFHASGVAVQSPFSRVSRFRKWGNGAHMGSLQGRKVNSWNRWLSPISIQRENQHHHLYRIVSIFIHSSIFNTAIPWTGSRGVVGAFPSWFRAKGRLPPEPVASQPQRTHRDKQPFRPSLSGNRSHVARKQVRRGYHDAINDPVF